MKSLRELPVPAGKRGLKLPHQSQYPDEDIAWAREQGYDPVDIRFSDSVYLALQGVIMGTVVLSEDQLKALELRARLEKAGHRDPEESKETKSRQADLVGALGGIPISNLFAAKGAKKKEV